MEGQLKIMFGEHIGISPLPFKKPPKDTCTFEYDNNPLLISLSFLSFFLVSLLLTLNTFHILL